MRCLEYPRSKASAEAVRCLAETCRSSRSSLHVANAAVTRERESRNLDPFMIHEAFPYLTETASGSHPCCVVSVTYDRTQCFHGGNTGSNPVGDAKYFQEVTPRIPLCCDTQKIHTLSAESCLPLCSARLAFAGSALGCRCPASSLT